MPPLLQICSSGRVECLQLSQFQGTIACEGQIIIQVKVYLPQAHHLCSVSAKAIPREEAIWEGEPLEVEHVPVEVINEV